MTNLLPTPASPTDWIRIFASRLARNQPDACAEDVIRVAIDHYKRSSALAPETAADQLSRAA